MRTHSIRNNRKTPIKLICGLFSTLLASTCWGAEIAPEGGATHPLGAAATIQQEIQEIKDENESTSEKLSKHDQPHIFSSGLGLELSSFAITFSFVNYCGYQAGVPYIIHGVSLIATAWCSYLLIAPSLR